MFYFYYFELEATTLCEEKPILVQQTIRGTFTDQKRENNKLRLPSVRTTIAQMQIYIKS